MADVQLDDRSLPIPLKGPGRSAPTLIEDLILYDPRQPQQAGSLSLEDDLRIYTQAQSVAQLLPQGSCQHDFCLKSKQSAPSAVDERPGPESIWQIAAICQRCRVHLLLKVDYTQRWQDHPCPTWENPLHHLRSSSRRQDAAYKELHRLWEALQKEDPESSNEIHIYECTSSTCSAVVTVHLTPPIFTEETIHLLVDKELLAKRTAAAFEWKRGNTEGMRRPSPLDVLADLKAYILNMWKAGALRDISGSNKRFAVRYGPDGTACKDVFEMLGFEYESASGVWRIPIPEDIDEPEPLRKPQNVFLDNVLVELDVLIANRPLEEKQASQDTTKLEAAILQMSRVLSCQNYDRDPGSRATRLALNQRPRPFNILRIPQDASDELVTWAYQRQMASTGEDLKMTAQLMTALEDIQRQRQSEKLGNQVAIERSIGHYGEQTLADAFKTIGITTNPNDVSDDVVIGSFEARLSDAPMQEQQMRESLAIIGEYRSSQRLIDFASNVVSTYEDALRFFDVNENTDDSFISAMYTSKISDNAGNREMAQKSLMLIADHRNSESLKAFIASGFQGEIQDEKMDIGEAYTLLGVEDRTFDDETLFAIYEARVDEQSSNSAKLRKAIETIAEHNNGACLKDKLQMPGLQQRPAPPPRASATEPVGLDNIGNTCYLNSLLQWLFTIMTVRKIVLNFEEYKRQDLVALAGKRVGQRAISVAEMRSAQRFVTQLAGLFDQMIISSNRAIRPAQELARLTLETETVKTGRKSSTAASHQRRPTLGMVDGRPQFGPLPNPAMTMEGEQPLQSPDLMEISATPEPTPPTSNLHPVQGPQPQEAVDTRDNDTASDITLVSNGAAQDAGGSVVGVAERQTTDDVQMKQEEQAEADVTIPDGTAPLHTTDMEPENQVDAQIDEQKQQQDATLSRTPPTQQDPVTSTQDVPMIYQPPPGPPPSPPPPVPPRNTPTHTLEEWARQQDVSEVINHAIIQLSSAIQPRGYDESGEQQDDIHDTFNGAVRYHYLAGNASPEAPRPFLFLFAPIENHPTDLYSSLDNGFDRETIEGTSFVRYESITKLPPVLLINLGRAVYDQTGNQRKLNYHVNIPDTLFMDRYLDAPDDSVLVRRRMQTWAYKDELRGLQARLEQLEPEGNPPVDESLSIAAAALQHLADVAATDNIRDLIPSPTLPTKFGELSEKARLERRDLSTRIATLEQQIQNSFADSAFLKHEYKLHAAFFHRGTVGSGHYWIYIYDHVNELWRKYNDDYVTPVFNRNEIFGNPEGDSSNPNSGYTPANAYFLVYVRADQLSGSEPIVETLKRNIVEQARPQPTQDEGYVSEGGGGGGGGGGRGEAALRPLGTDTPPPDSYHNSNGKSSHHEFAGQPSQMSSLSPDNVAPILKLRSHEHDPASAQLGQNAINSHATWPTASTSQMQSSGGGGGGGSNAWVNEDGDPELAAAIERSLCDPPTKTEGQTWDDSENMAYERHQ